MSPVRVLKHIVTNKKDPDTHLTLNTEYYKSMELLPKTLVLTF